MKKKKVPPRDESPALASGAEKELVAPGKMPHEEELLASMVVMTN